MYTTLFPLIVLIKSVSLTIVLSPLKRRSFVFEPHLLHVLGLHHFEEVFLHLVGYQGQVAHPGEEQLGEGVRRRGEETHD